MRLYLVDKDDEAAMSAMEKLRGEHKPNEVILMTKREIHALTGESNGIHPYWLQEDPPTDPMAALGAYQGGVDIGALHLCNLQLFDLMAKIEKLAHNTSYLDENETTELLSLCKRRYDIAKDLISRPVMERLYPSEERDGGQE